MVRDTGGVKNEKKTIRKLDLFTGDEQEDKRQGSGVNPVR